MTGAELFSPETVHLIACLRGALGTAAWPIRPNLNWGTFVRDVDRHRTGAFLHHRRPPAGDEPWPGAVGQRLQVIASNTLRQSIRQAALQQQLLKRLDNRGVAALALKGVALSQQLYGGLGRRHAGDIDLLIRRRDVSAADAALQEFGLKRSRPDFPLTPRQLRSYLRNKPEFEYLDAATRQRVELLWRAEFLEETDDLWARTTAVRLGEQTVSTMAPGLNALYLFEHGSRHGWFRLFWVLDIALLLQTGADIDWSDVLERARTTGNERAVLQGAFLASELFGVPLPGTLTPRRAENRNVHALTTEALREIRRPENSQESVGLWARRAGYRVRLQRRISGKFRVLSPHLFTPESWRMCPLPDRLFWAYPVVTPFLWVWRRMRKRPAAPSPARVQPT